MKLFRLRCRNLFLVMLASAVIGCSMGCMSGGASTLAAAGTVIYARGELDATLGNSSESVDKATNTALTDLRFVRTNEKKDALVSLYEVRTAEDKKVSVKVYRISDALTKVKIRVDFFGNQALSRTILEKIQVEL